MSSENMSRIHRKQMRKDQELKTRYEINQKRKKKRTFFKKILLMFGITIILATIAASLFVINIIKDAPVLSASDLEDPLSTRVYDQDDELISTLFRDENRIKVTIDDIPGQLRDALISIEDKRFYDHNGIDIYRIAGAATANVKHGWGVEGGSTLSQQLIKRSVLSSEKTLKRKIKEAWLSLKLEKEYSKDEILEMYFNNVYFGHGAYGIQMASMNYFGVEDLFELNLAQIALLAGLPNAPSAGNPFDNPDQAKDRMNQVLRAMVKNDVISDEERKEASEIEIADLLQENVHEDAIPFNAYIDVVYDQIVKKEKLVSEKDFYQGGLEIHTYLNKEAQQMIDELLHSDDIPYPDEHFETGISLIDTKTGVIQAIGGGRNFTSIQDINYGAHVKNQPGSTIKPILSYGPAIEHLKWSTAHNITDAPHQYSDGTPVNNFDNKHWGDMTIRRALEWSRNIPALKTFQEVGSEQAQTFAGELGIEVDPIYESAALGGFDGVSPLELASAYAAFGNGGEYSKPSTVRKIVFPDGEEWKPEPKSHKAMQDYTAYMITDMLKTVITSGTGVQANIPSIPIAGKTGSTNIPREIREQYGIESSGLIDSWFAGYTTEYSLAIWSGYPSLKAKDTDDIQYIRADGTQHIPKILFKEIMTELSNEQTPDFKQPDSVVANGAELYVRGKEIQKRQEPKREEKVEEEEREKEEEVKEEKEEEERKEEEEFDKVEEEDEAVEVEKKEKQEEKTDDKKEEKEKEQTKEKDQEEHKDKEKNNIEEKEDTKKNEEKKQESNDNKENKEDIEKRREEENDADTS